MPLKASKALQLQKLIQEQEDDKQNRYVFSEKITPRRKLESPASLTLTEYVQLLLELGNLTREQISQVTHTSVACVSQHRWNAYKKLGPESTAKWKKICRAFRIHHLSLLPAQDSPASTEENGEAEPTL